MIRALSPPISRSAGVLEWVIPEGSAASLSARAIFRQEFPHLHEFEGPDFLHQFGWDRDDAASNLEGERYALGGGSGATGCCVAT